MRKVVRAVNVNIVALDERHDNLAEREQSCLLAGDAGLRFSAAKAMTGICVITSFFRTSAAERTFFFGSPFGDRDGVQSRDGCADEDENPGLSQTSDPAAS